MFFEQFEARTWIVHPTSWPQPLDYLIHEHWQPSMQTAITMICKCVITITIFEAIISYKIDKQLYEKSSGLRSLPQVWDCQFSNPGHANRNWCCFCVEFQIKGKDCIEKQLLISSIAKQPSAMSAPMQFHCLLAQISKLLFRQLPLLANWKPLQQAAHVVSDRHEKHPCVKLLEPHLKQLCVPTSLQPYSHSTHWTYDDLCSQLTADLQREHPEGQASQAKLLFLYTKAYPWQHFWHPSTKSHSRQSSPQQAQPSLVMPQVAMHELQMPGAEQVRHGIAQGKHAELEYREGTLLTQKPGRHYWQEVGAWQEAHPAGHLKQNWEFTGLQYPGAHSRQVRYELHSTQLAMMQTEHTESYSQQPGIQSRQLDPFVQMAQPLEHARHWFADRQQPPTHMEHCEPLQLEQLAMGQGQHTWLTEQYPLEQLAQLQSLKHCGQCRGQGRQVFEVSVLMDS